VLLPPGALPTPVAHVLGVVITGSNTSVHISTGGPLLTTSLVVQEIAG
jgi:hypothetical protein